MSKLKQRHKATVDKHDTYLALLTALRTTQWHAVADEATIGWSGSSSGHISNWNHTKWISQKLESNVTSKELFALIVRRILLRRFKVRAKLVSPDVVFLSDQDTLSQYLFPPRRAKLMVRPANCGIAWQLCWGRGSGWPAKDLHPV